MELFDGYKSSFITTQRDENTKKRFKMLVKAHETYVDSLPIYEPVLTAGDLLRIQEVKEIVLAEPLENQVDRKFLKQVVEKLPRYNKSWLQDVKKKLLQAMESAVGKNTLDSSSLSLATAFFECRLCHRKGWHGMDMVHHSCARAPSARNVFDTLEHHLKAFIEHTGKCPWNIADCIVFDSEASKSAVALVEKLGLEPATLTVEAMDKLDPIFEIPSTKKAVGRTMYTWRAMAVCAGKLLNGTTVIDSLV